MKFGIIGFGNIAHKIVKSIEGTDAIVYAIGSKTVDENKDEYLLNHKEVVLYRDYNQLLEDDNVEAVYITLPHKYHYQWIIKALEHHKAVICEKPIVLTAKQMEEVVKKARQEKTYCLEAMKTKLNVGFQQLKKDCQNLGGIKHIYCAFGSDDLSVVKDSYLYDPQQGGALYDVGSYPLSFILGLTEEKITDIKVDYKLMDSNIDIYEKVDVAFQSGITACFECAKDRKITRTATVECQNGTVIVENFNRTDKYTIETSEGSQMKLFEFKGNDMSLQIQCLVDDVNNGLIENKLHDFSDMLYQTEMMEKIKNKLI